MRKQKSRFFIISLLKQFALYCLFFFLIVVVAGCGKQKEKKVQKEITKQEAYHYQSFFQPIPIEADDIFSLCRKENRIFMLGSKEKEEHYFLISCDFNGKDMIQTKLVLKKGEKAELLSINSKGQYYLLTSIFVKKKEREQYYLHILKEDGTSAKRYHLKEEENYPIYIGKGRAVIMEDGSVLAIGNQEVYLFDSKGKKKKQFDFRNEVIGIFFAGDGNYYSYGYDNSEINIIIKRLDLEKGFSKEIALNDLQKNSLDIFAGKETILYLNDRSKVSSFDLTEGNIKPLFDWISIGINEDNIREVFFIDDNSFRMIEKTEQAKLEFIIVKRVENKEVEEKKVLTLACTKLNKRVKEHILDFNRKEKDYQIEVKDYSEYEDVVNALNLDMISGQIPDILCMDGLPADRYQKKGILTDLYPLMGEDKEVRKEDFIDSVRNAAEQDGKLFIMGSTFCLNALVGSKELLKDKNYITFKDLEKIYKTMPGDNVFIDFMSRQDFPCSVVCDQMENYINWESGEVFFNTKEFIKVLEFSKNFPDRKDIYIGKNKSAKDGTILLKKFSFTQLDMIQEYDKIWKNSGGCSVVGYPKQEKDTKISMEFQEPAFAITEQCNNKKGAWKFLRQFFTYEYQMQGGNNVFDSLLGIPVRKDALKKKLKYAMTVESYTEKDGTRIEPINTTSQDGEYEIKIGPLSKKEVKKIYSIIDCIGRIGISYNIATDMTTQKVCEIIQEELGAFFAEDKTAEETAEIIQNRVKLYVNETL